MDERVEEPVRSQHTPSRKKKWLVLVVVCIALVGIAAAVLIYTRTAANPLSKYASRVSFPLYYPAKLPQTYRLDASSIKASSDLVFYQVVSSSKKPALVISQQSAPNDFDVDKIAGKDTSKLAVPIGTLYDISAGEQSRYLLTTGTSLIFINSINKVETGAVNFLASNLQKVE